MHQIDKFKQTVLKEYRRYGPGDTFTFACHRGLVCFNKCCRDVTIFLTPYDILRMKNRLNIDSEEFLVEYTVLPFTKEQRLPVAVLKMRDDDEKHCPFVSGEGCTIYEDRPWACRMYPLGFASPKENEPSEEGDFYFLLHESGCQGFEEKTQWTIADWLEDQGVTAYNRMGEAFKEITLHDYFQQGNNLSPEKMEMFYLACYNLDRFRSFIFGSSFLRRFDIDESTVEKIQTDDVELMKFGMNWLRFCLFGEKTMKMNEEETRRMREGASATS